VAVIIEVHQNRLAVMIELLPRQGGGYGSLELFISPGEEFEKVIDNSMLHLRDEGKIRRALCLCADRLEELGWPGQ
jgi:hypothetical protein